MNQAGARWLAQQQRSIEAAREARQRPAISDPLPVTAMDEPPPRVVLVREWCPLEYCIPKNDRLALMELRCSLPRSVQAA